MRKLFTLLLVLMLAGCAAKEEYLPPSGFYAQPYSAVSVTDVVLYGPSANGLKGTAISLTTRGNIYKKTVDAILGAVAVPGFTPFSYPLDCIEAGAVNGILFVNLSGDLNAVSDVTLLVCALQNTFCGFNELDYLQVYCGGITLRLPFAPAAPLGAISLNSLISGQELTLRYSVLQQLFVMQDDFTNEYVIFHAGNGYCVPAVIELEITRGSCQKSAERYLNRASEQPGLFTYADLGGKATFTSDDSSAHSVQSGTGLPAQAILLSCAQFGNKELNRLTCTVRQEGLSSVDIYNLSDNCNVGDCIIAYMPKGDKLARQYQYMEVLDDICLAAARAVFAAQGLPRAYVNAVWREGTVAVMDISAECREYAKTLTVTDEKLLLFSVVNTVCALRGITGVRLLCEGRTVQYFGNAVCTEQVLRYAAGLVE